MVLPPRLIIRALQHAALGVALLAGASAGARAEDTKADKASEGCPQYGAGFKRLPGSDTCIQMGGAMQFSAGRGTGFSNAPNQGPQVTPQASDSSSVQPITDPWKQAR